MIKPDIFWLWRFWVHLFHFLGFLVFGWNNNNNNDNNDNNKNVNKNVFMSMNSKRSFWYITFMHVEAELF